jgi:hypothetical protein
MTLTQDFDEEEVEGLKVKILAAVASLDRGLAANVSGAITSSSSADVKTAVFCYRSAAAAAAAAVVASPCGRLWQVQ